MIKEIGNRRKGFIKGYYWFLGDLIVKGSDVIDVVKINWNDNFVFWNNLFM